MHQRVVAVRKDGGSFLLLGDPEAGSDKNRMREILPTLLEQGWIIRSIHMTASAAVNDDQVLGLAVLEKS